VADILHRTWLKIELIRRIKPYRYPPVTSHQMEPKDQEGAKFCEIHSSFGCFIYGGIGNHTVKSKYSCELEEPKQVKPILQIDKDIGS
jgi:hypothetical protein